MSIYGCMADTSTVDTPSANPTANYPLLSHGGGNVICTTIFAFGAPLTHMDPTVPAIPVPGVPMLPPPSLPDPAVLGRPSVAPIVNSVERGVYFEGKLVPVIGDAINGAGAIPVNRPLTGLGKHVTIIIGTRS